MTRECALDERIQHLPVILLRHPFAAAFVVLLLVGSALNTASAQSGKITGVVTDAETGLPLPGVNVVIEGTTRGSSTDLEGRYFILNVSPETYNLRASMVGYQTVVNEGVEVHINRTTTVNFDLAVETIEGGEVIVTAERPDVELDQTATLEIVRPEELVGTPGMTDLGDLLSMQAEVSDGHFRGGRANEELYVLAGMGIVNPLNSSRSFTPILSAIEEVEVITSGFSAEYGNAMSGVINISMKEGGSQWDGRFESRTRMPGYKHWGGSMFDPANNPYMQQMNSLEWWLQPDPDNPQQQRWEGAIGRAFGNAYLDSLQGAQITYDLWRQGHQDIGHEYGQRPDQLFGANIGGPLGEDTRLFVAAQFNDTWPVLPTPQPNQERQVMGNLVQNVGSGMKLKLSGSYANNFFHEFSSSSAGFYRWYFDRILGANKIRDKTWQAGANWSHVLNDRSFYDVNLGILSTDVYEGVDALLPSDSTFRDDIYERSLWERVYWPDGFRTGVMDDDFFDEHSRTYSLVVSYTNQVTSNHQIKAGFQGNLFDVDVRNNLNRSSASVAEVEYYSAQPYEGGLYVQDKMEFEGMIANVGLRVDAYNQNIEYYVDRFSPFSDPDNPGQTDPDAARTADSPSVVRLQPRLGFSFPVSENAVFHLNYGNYLKRPSLEYLIGRRTSLGRGGVSTIEARRLGNPTLKPEETRAYDVGIVLGLMAGFTLDASGYYKDVKNLVERVVYLSETGRLYESLINRDYADIRGFSLRLNKRSGIVTGSARYNYSVVTGKSSSPFGNSRVIDEEGVETQLPSPKDIYLDYDRRHKMVLSLGFESPGGWGPSVAGFHPFERFNISALHRTQSGRPYTPYVAGGEDQGSAITERTNSARSPWEFNTDLKITREIVLPQQVRGRLYIEVFNLFNQRIYDYSRVFQDPENRQKWAQNRDDIEYFTNDNGYTANQSLRVYGNAPRSINVGFVVNF